MSYLISVVEKHRVATMAEADDLETQARSDAHYSVIKCTKTERVRKEKGEIADQWVVVDITKLVDDMKEPSGSVTVEYH